MMIFIALTACLLLPLTAYAAPTIDIEKPEYRAGESLTISGTATPYYIVSIQVLDPDGTRKAIAQATAAADGSFTATAIYTFTATDPQGTWAVRAYETGIFASTAFEVKPPLPPSLTISITPDKHLYPGETIIITIVGDRFFTSASISVTQKGAEASELEATPAMGDARKWGGSYTITAGNDGVAMIKASAISTEGATTSSSKIFIIDASAPQITIRGQPTTNDPKVTFSGTIDDPSVATVEVTVGELPPIEVGVTNLAWSTSFELPTTGTYTVTVSAIDIAGNTGKASTTIAYLTAVSVPGVEEIAKDVLSIKTNVDSLRGDVRNTQSGVSGLKSEVSGLKSDVAGLKSDVSGLKTDISSLKGDLAKTDINISNLADKMIELGSRIGTTAGGLSDIENSITQVSFLILAAVILSIIAAVAAILSVVTIVRRIVLK